MNKLHSIARGIARVSPGKRMAALAAVLGTSVAKVQAAVPAGVTTAIEGTGTDLVTVVTAVIVAFIAFWGLRKLGQKFGWL